MPTAVEGLAVATEGPRRKEQAKALTVWTGRALSISSELLGELG